MSAIIYPPPVDQFLSLGEPGHQNWRDYVSMGIGNEHIPELIRMVGDGDLNDADGASPLVWAPLHAWRALAQLRAEQAIAPLLGLLQRIDDQDDDWMSEDMPEVFARIGPAAIEPLAAYLGDPAHGLYARICAAFSLSEIGQQVVGSRQACVAAVTNQLERFAENDPTMNGFLVSALVDLRAKESARVIQSAFKARQVDTDIGGDWADVREELGV